MPFEVCYPGADGSNDTCFPLVEAAPYEYPAPFATNYDAPVRFLSIPDLDLSAWIAPNFVFAEIADPVTGSYQVVQPHAIEKLQQVRDVIGPLIVRAGFRSPLYNAGAGGVPNSRHLFGDAFDLEPVDATPELRAQLHQACLDAGAGYVETYDNGHVHCDWRNIANDPAFFDASSDEGVEWHEPPELVASVVPEGDSLRVDVGPSESREGELSRTWTAYADDGTVVGRADSLTFDPPPRTALVDVDVGHVLTLSYGVIRR
jgi:hypothetical protein